MPVMGWVRTLGLCVATCLSPPHPVDGTVPSPLSSSREGVMDSTLGQPSALCRALVLAVGGFVVFIQHSASCIYLRGSSSSQKDTRLEIRPV